MEQLKNFDHYMQEKFYEFFNAYKSQLPLPYFKCFIETIYAMISVSCPIIRQISQHFKGNTTVKKKQERISYHLSKKENFEKLNDAVLQRQSTEIKKDTLIIIDGSDITKPNAKCMQHIKKIRDGSTGELVNGYYTFNAVTVDSDSLGNLNINPLYSYLYSNDIEKDTQNTRLIDFITDSTLYSGNKGIYVFDRGYDSRILIEELIKNDNDFVIRSTGKRDLVVDRQKCSFRTALDLIKLKHEYKCPLKNKLIKYGVKKVGVITDPHPKKDPTTVSLYLIKARYGDSGGLFYFYAYFKDDNMAEVLLGQKVLEIYVKRWKIEEFFRHIKTEYKVEDIQLINYNRLQSIYLWMFLMFTFIYSCKKELLRVSDKYRHFVYDFNNDMIALNGFSFYRLSKILKMVFIGYASRKRRKDSIKKPDPRQITLETFILENFGVC